VFVACCLRSYSDELVANRLQRRRESVEQANDSCGWAEVTRESSHGGRGRARAQDASVWRRLAGESHEQGNLTQAIYCLSRVVRIMPEDAEVRWDRALLLARTGDHKKVPPLSLCVSHPAAPNPHRQVCEGRAQLGVSV
jgi:hypothetical protein